LLNYFVISVTGRKLPGGRRSGRSRLKGQNGTHAILEPLTSYRRRRTTTHILPDYQDDVRGSNEKEKTKNYEKVED